MKLLVRVFGVLLLSTTTLFTAGCGSSFDGSSVPPSQTSLGAIQGMLHGGQQAVAGAKIYLFATGTGGSAGNGVTAASKNESFSLLTSSGNTSFDGTNYYVVSGTYGDFSISGDYQCTVGSQVYIYAVGGNTGSGENSNAGFLAGLGACPAAKNLATTVPFIYMDEISTVVTAYALAGFATDATHISTGSAIAGTGIANAMATVANLTNIATGLTYATTHATGSSGTIPQDMINAIADILAACINSNPSSSSSCSTLLNDDRSGGGQTGTKATDTATAAIYLAQHPYSSQVGTLFNLITGVANPFPTSLKSAPANYVIAVTYTGNGVTRSPVNPDPGYPGTVAVDGLGDVWVVNYSTNTVSAFSPLGVPLSGSPFSDNGNISVPYGLAVDTNNRIWIANYGPNSASKESISILNDDGSAYADPTDNGTNCINDGGNIAFDNSGNAWLSQIGGYSVCKMTSTATNLTIVGGTSLSNPLGIAGDASGNMWVASTDQGGGHSQVNKFNSSGTNINGSPFLASQILNPFSVAIDMNGNAWVSNASNMVEIASGGSIGPAITGGGIAAPNGVAVDGANNIWETDYGTYNSTTNRPNGNGAVIELNSSGTALSGTAGYQSGTTFSGQGLAIDGSGNVWVDNLVANSVRELIGAAAPVVTPLSLAVKNNQLGIRP
jgi:hypothetical protein